MESEINPNVHHELNANKIRVTNLLTILTSINNLAKWLNHTITICNLTITTDFGKCQYLDKNNWNPRHIIVDNNGIPDIAWQQYYDDLNIDLIQKVQLWSNESSDIAELRKIASVNMISNVTTFYHYKDNSTNTSVATRKKLGQYFQCQSEKELTTEQNFPNLVHMGNKSHFDDYSSMYWRIRPEAWVAAGITISTLGILISFSILIFIIVRIYMEDVLEGNPIGTIALLIALILMFASFAPFSVEYTSDRLVIEHSEILFNADFQAEEHIITGAIEVSELLNTLCLTRLFLVTVCYCFTFSLLLCRALMLASIGSEGGFLSHVNGYIQSVICIFSTLVQVGLSTQLMMIMYAAQSSISCYEIYYGFWFWILIGYDSFLLIFLALLSPLIVQSQRNYREGVLILCGTLLCAAVWATWIPLSTFGDMWRDAAIALGVQGTGWAILCGILIPRCFLIVRGIARSDLAQALPSLTSLAFVHNNQYVSEQVSYNKKIYFPHKFIILLLLYFVFI